MPNRGAGVVAGRQAVTERDADAEVSALGPFVYLAFPLLLSVVGLVAVKMYRRCVGRS